MKALGAAAFPSEPEPQITAHDPHRHHALSLQAPAQEAAGLGASRCRRVLARSRCHETSATDAGCCILHNRTVARGRFALVAQRLSRRLDPYSESNPLNARNSATCQARASPHQTASSVLASGTAISPMAGALNAALSRELGRDHTAASGRMVRSCRGSRWWTERHEPRGWRCGTCHPPGPLPAETVSWEGNGLSATGAQHASPGRGIGTAAWSSEVAMR
jgi:hypothetical protein